MSAYEDDMKRYFASVNIPKSKEKGIATPEYCRGFTDGRKYALNMVKRLLESSLNTTQLMETLDRLLED